MTEPSSLDVLVAQLQVQMEELRSLLVTSPRRSASVTAVARRIAAGLGARGVHTALITVQGDNDERHDSSSEESEVGDAELDIRRRSVTAQDLGTLQAARSLLAVTEGIVVLEAAGVLEYPAAVFLAAAADAVLVVAERGRTARVDLARARAEINAAGGHLVAAVLRD